MDLSYQWKKDGEALVGKTSSILSIDPVGPVDAGNYTVDVTNPCGTVTSNEATLKVEIWQSLGVYVTSNPNTAITPGGESLIITARGGDNALWLRNLKLADKSGGWIRLGGYITSDNHYSIFDNQGKRHTFVRGGDGALWDNMDGNWRFFGGYITSDAKATYDPTNTDNLCVFVQGGNGAVWQNTINTTTGSFSWKGLGGYIPPHSGIYEATPEAVIGDDNSIHVFVCGGDNALWEYASGNWHFHGGYITSDPEGVGAMVAVRGGDEGVWIYNIQ